MLIAPLFSLIAGLLVLGYIVQKLFYAWFGSRSARQPGVGWFARLFEVGVKKLQQQKIDALKDARFAFSQNNLAQCQKKLNQSFFFGNYAYFVLPENLHKQHLSILDALLSFSQAKGLHAANIEKIEELIDQLANSHTLFLNETRNRKKVRNTPEWASKELNKKRAAIKKQLKDLEQSILKEVELLFKEISTTQHSNFTVH